jgi:hypothetical protein
MSTLTLARKARFAEAVLVHISCAGHVAGSVRYGDALACIHCGELLQEDTPGMVELDLALANGEIDCDLYDEIRDMLLGHP